MKKVILLLLFATSACAAPRPPIEKFAQLSDVNLAGVVVGNTVTWNGTKWVPATVGSGGIPSLGGNAGKFLTTNGSTANWGVVGFGSLGGVPTTLAGYGITDAVALTSGSYSNPAWITALAWGKISGTPTTAVGYSIVGGANIDLWGAKTPYAGTLTITTGKTANVTNTLTLSGTDGSTLNIGAGGTLGSNAYTSTAYVPQTTTVNSHALSGNINVTRSDLALGHIFIGSGSPEGAVVASVGSLFSRTDGGSGTSLYVKQSGSGNTGWTADPVSTGSGLPAGGTIGQVLVKNSSTDGDASWTADPGGTGGGSGTVTSVSVTTANGVSGSVATSTTTPAITLSLGAITPSSVVSSGSITGSNLSGTNTGDQTITLTGAVTGSGTGSFATTIPSSSVALGKLADLAANSFIGNNTGSPTTPIALTYSQTKTALSLNLVENTALSTWAGSTNITTLGTISTGTVPVARVTGLATSATTDTTNAANITSGTLPAARLPALSGDVTTSAGSAVTNIANTTVAAGNYVNTNLTVAADGRITTANNGNSLGIVNSVSFSSTVTPAVGNYGSNITYNIGALTGNITIAAPTGTQFDGQSLYFRFTQDGTGSRTVTWNAAYKFGTDITAAMEPTTASAKWERAFRWNSVDNKWRCVGLARGF